MMHELFKKAVKGRRFNDSEAEFLQKIISDLRDYFENNGSNNFSAISIASNVAIGLASRSEKSKDKVEDFIGWLENPKSDFQFDEDIDYLCNVFYMEIVSKRTESIIEGINKEKSLTLSDRPADFVASLDEDGKERIYENVIHDLDIDFTVDRLNFPCEVLDPRVVSIKPGKGNEMHRHAHETIFVFLEGNGKVIVDNIENEVKSGSFAYIPRWSVHQTINTGEKDLKFLAVADFGLTGKSFVGNYHRTARLKEA